MSRPPRSVVSVADRRIRVALFTPTLLTGGAERQMILLAQALPADRFDVRFVLMAERGPLAEQAQSAGFPVHSLGLDRGSATRISFAALSQGARAIRRYRRVAEHVDIVDAWLAPAYSFAAALRPIAHVPVLLAGRRNLHDVAGKSSGLRGSVGRFALRHVDAIVANSQAGADDVIRIENAEPSRVHVIRNAVVPARRSAEVRAMARLGWGVTDDELVVGCVANLKPGKGHDALLAVAMMLRDRHPNIRYILVGDGPQRPHIERHIRERGLGRTVVLHGADHDTGNVYPGFDIAFHASETESLPNAVLEAAAACLPIVATRVGGTAEIITDGWDGILMDPHDVSGMAERLSDLASDPASRALFGSRAAARAHEFSSSRLASDTGDLYVELLGRAMGRSNVR